MNINSNIMRLGSQYEKINMKLKHEKRIRNRFIFIKFVVHNMI